MLGESGGALVYFPLIPRADARLLAIDELRSREGSRRGPRPGGFLRGDEELTPRSDFDARSSATAAEVERGFSVVVCTSSSERLAAGLSEEWLRRSESL
jgi:hypothetical protein